jgi:hypothetical protein
MSDQQTTIATPPPEIPSVGRAISRFVSEVKALKRTEEFVMPLLSAVAKRTDDSLEAFISKENIEKREENGKQIFTVPIPKVRYFERLQKQSQSYGIAFYQTPGALLVALVSRYDAYLGQLLRSLFYLKPELLNASQRSLSFQQLVEFSDLSKAREYVVEKEIESVIRESHSKQFEWMESRFDVPLRKGLESWPCFIEITERRNLFVHTAGTVSSQYLDVCRKHGVCAPTLKSGDSLWGDADYFQKAFECLFEMGVKLGHVL